VTAAAARKAKPAPPRSNALLAGMSAKERVALHLRMVTVKFGDVLDDTKTIRNVYFPVDCLVSLLAPLKDHFAVEVGMIGNEGMLGVPIVLGMRRSSVQEIVQGSGTALYMEVAAFRRALQLSTALQTRIHRYIYTLMGQLTQTAACNAFHPIEARCARWLLMTRDRMQSDKLELTHEFLAHMLGVRRVCVTFAAGNLQRDGLIEYYRGHIRIIDPERLEAIACECYSAVKNLYKKANGS